MATHHLSVISCQSDAELARVRARIEHVAEIEDRDALDALLGSRLSAGIVPRPMTLDLIGHGGPRHSLLALGDWTIDAADPRVSAFFRELADHDVFHRLGITAIRLLGCETARTSAGRETIGLLSRLTGIEVFGARTMISSDHYDRTGFSDANAHLLVSSGELTMYGPPSGPGDPPWPRNLDIETLPAIALAAAPRVAWPRLIATREDGAELIRTIRRDEGGPMAGLAVVPVCEIAIPAFEPGRFWFVEILLDGAMIRVHPNERAEGVCYPTTDPAAIQQLVAQSNRSGSS
jgi:hypothetical protein